jgi:TRAP-type C4-dicarboxylate transport system permease small subunit
MEAGLPSRIHARTVLFLRVLVVVALAAAAWACVHYLPGFSAQQSRAVGGLLPRGSSAVRSSGSALGA